MYSYIRIFKDTNNMFPRICQCDLSYQTKCTKRTGIIRLVDCRQSCKSFFIGLPNLFLLSILFRETIKVGEITIVRAVARACTVTACATCCMSIYARATHSSRHRSNFSFDIRTWACFFLIKQYIYRMFARAYSYVRRVRAGNLSRFPQSILFMLLLICLFFRFNRTCSRLSSDSYIKLIKSERSCGVTLRFDFPLDLARKVQASLLLYICI